MKACIFDLDGTLADTLESLVYSVRETLKEMNLPGITREECRAFVGSGARRLMEQSLVAAGDTHLARIEEGMEVYGRIFDANCTYHVTPYDGMKETLRVMRESGIKLSVLSNKPHCQTVKVIHHVFGTELFDCIQGQVENIARKPDPAGVYELLQLMGIEKEQCLYVGDSEVDMATGRNAGIKSVGVTWGFRTEEILKEAGAREIAHTPRQLLSYVSLRED